MLARLLLYGCGGWVLEVGFTGLSALLRGDRQATARTYLWMHPIYGATALVLERLQRRLRGLPRPVRALACTATIYTVEYASGYLLRQVLGRCPWDYTGRGWNVQGLVRLDYAPLWYGAALLFEPVHGWLEAAHLPHVGEGAPQPLLPSERASRKRSRFLPVTPRA